MTRPFSLVLALVLVLVAAAAAGCPKKDNAVVVVDAGAAVAPPPPEGTKGEVVLFPGAAGWSGGRACTDVEPDSGCDSQWLHTSGQVVRVFVVDVKDQRALDTFVDKLAADVAQKGGVVDRFTQNGLTLVRFLQPMIDEKGEKLASINYALLGRDNKAVHLITSVVAFDAQREADQRLRELLQAAAWAPR